MRFLIAASFFLASVHSRAELCSSWSSSVTVGHLNPKILKEASGIVVTSDSKKLLHINDSGDGPLIYQTDLAGTFEKKIRIRDFKPRDVEEITMGPCGKEHCLYVADIGDNRRRRTSVEILLIKEELPWSDEVSAQQRLKIQYPNGPHDAEAFIVDSQGDLYLFTKELHRTFWAKPSQVFLIPNEIITANHGETIIPEKIGEINLPVINWDFPALGQLVTAAALSSDGHRLMLLSYVNIIEFDFDLLKTQWKRRALKFNVYATPKLYQKIRTPWVRQQEGMVFLDGSHRLLISSEAPGSHPKPSELLEIDCQEGSLN